MLYSHFIGFPRWEICGSIVVWLFGLVIGIVVSFACLPILVGQLRHQTPEPCAFFKTEARLSGPNALRGALRGEEGLEFFLKYFRMHRDAERILGNGLYRVADQRAQKEGPLFCYTMAYTNIVFPDQFDAFFEEAAHNLVQSLTR